MREHGPTRRALLGGSLSLVAACGPLGRADSPDLGNDRELAILRRAINAEEALIARYKDATGRYPHLEARLAPIVAHHRQHAAALRRRLPPGVTPTPSESPPGRFAGRSPGASPVRVPAPLPDSPELALEALGSHERALATARIKQLRDVSAPLAQLLASLGASEAGHTVLLAEYL
ncbi:MAG: hypothetical protein GEV03_13065 [Streptosporangiales bacterium]|nr:hypothetical protein [Streptosporangiales bacterium]